MSKVSGKSIRQKPGKSITSNGLIQRYRFHGDNLLSRHLAESIGLKQRLTVTHFGEERDKYS
jgi:hypothetical protein